ncbi:MULTISPECIES: thiamine phosphate synthase [Legionella]|uniref:Thiamine-phosphate synthase n=1 Tax=Legionella septentrionalis TaxID=2498109 RepID=A0A433JIA2_9GAMM|nr:MULTISPECIES: thiamine phosphate synthase [Legionella]MCP0914517.1 thiamine phosphate synthase [Legionella sp. 27cVA30]RUQ85008.1 thiamine phosphate synthase [Legionella septentrionalis]RUR02357.1 thiamine phosphate synthase [Legionella septentrionalis]RUR17014.1 thiamine phosphate synthase [Legionella septentrionalis]
MIATFKLCLVTNFHGYSEESYLKLICEAVAGGVSMVQLRDKSSRQHETYHWGMAIKRALQPFSVPLIVNDSIDLAIAIGADGVHLGQADASPVIARERLGVEKIIGLSIETFAQLEYANTLDCIDYVAASAVFPSATKPDCKTTWGLEGLRFIVDNSKHPVIAIGGIGLGNAQDVIKQGVAGIAVVSALHQPDSYQAAADLLETINDQ